jgi:hypothetical protein
VSNKKMLKTKTLTNLTVEQHEALKKMSAESLVPVTALVRLAVDQFLANGGIRGAMRGKS